MEALSPYCLAGNTDDIQLEILVIHEEAQDWECTRNTKKTRNLVQKALALFSSLPY